MPGVPRPHQRLSIGARVSIVAKAILLWCIVLVVIKNWGPITKDVMEFDAGIAFREVLRKSNFAGVWSKQFTKEAHLAGTNIELVKWQKEKFEEFGLENVEIDEYEVYLNYPLDHGLSLLKSGEIVFTPTLKEDELLEDPTTLEPGLVPAFHGYSASGNVTAEYVYANYGSKEDFQLLKEQEVNVTGKIVIVRYGGLFRGLKVKFAQEAGAIGVLIYSEPADDGEITQENGYKAYPEGPARNPSSLQRGSVQFLSQVPGDPTTPGWPSKGKQIRRVDPYNLIPKIPSLPISYKEVIPILKELNGQGKQLDKWLGSLKDVEYFTGPAKGVTLNLFNLQQYEIKLIYNIYGEIPGENEKEVIFVGNHRDAWIKGGAGDPNSGSATTLEIIRALNELKEKHGWKPKRTIKFASWDGEEYGLLGLTEYGEYNHKDLQKKVIAYLNLDVAATGHDLSLAAAPLLYQVINSNLVKIQHPVFNVSLHEHFYKRNKFIRTLGSGSDYTVFLEHLGISSSDMGFGPGKKDPVYHYHSNYDSYHWMATFGDPGFVMHNTMAQLLGLIIVDLSDSYLLPLGIRENAETLQTLFDYTVAKIPKDWLDKPVTSKDAQYLDLPDTCLGRHEHKSLVKMFHDIGYQPSAENPFSGLEHKNLTLSDVISLTNDTILSFVGTSAVVEIQKAEALKSLEDLEKEGYSHWNPIYQWKLKKILARFQVLNSKAKYLERHFLAYRGLTGRPWFRHTVYASGRNTGYAGQVYPGLTEGIEDGNLDEVRKWLFIINGITKKADKWLVVE